VSSLSLSLDNSRYVNGGSKVATVTLEVPDELLGDIYIAVGRVFRNYNDSIGSDEPELDEDDENRDEA
jgi:hypothetical protein